MIHGMPGPGGSLGQCVLCGKSFVTETLMSLAGCVSSQVHTIAIDGIEGELCIHAKCQDQLETLRGKGWEALPEGPLRDIYGQAASDQASDEASA